MAERPGLVSGSDFLGFLKRSFLLVLLFALMGALLAAVASAILPNIYTATALIEIQTQPSRVTPFEDVTTNIGPDSAAIASIIEIANSDSVLQTIAEKNDLAHDADLISQPLFGGVNKTNDVIQNLSKVLKVQRRGLTYIVEIAVSLRNPEKAAQLANSVAGIIAERQKNVRSGTSTDAVKIFEAKIATLQQNAVESARLASDYRVQHGLGELRSDGTIGDRRLTYLAQQIAQTRDKLEAARARYDEIKRAKPADMDTTSDAASSLLASLRTQYATQKRQLAELSMIYGPQHPSLLQIQQSLQVLAGQMNSELARVSATARTDLDALQKQISAMEAELARQNTSEISTAADRAELLRLDSQAALDKDIYDQFNKKQKVTEQQSNLNQPDVTLASAARVPTKSNKPPLILMVLAGGIVGAVFGFALSFLRQTGRTTPDMNAGASAIPSPSDQGGPIGHDKAVHSEDAQSGPVASAVVAAKQDLPHAAYTIGALLPPLPAPPNSNAAKLHVVDARAALQALIPEILSTPESLKSGKDRFGKDEKLGRMVAITTWQHAQGKTTTAVALAHLAAHAGASVLVVSDHGRGSEIAPGLLDIVSRKTNPRDLTSHDALSDFMLMRTGCAVPEDFWELAHHRNFAAVMRVIKETWDLVLVELPHFNETEDPHVPRGIFDMLLLIFDPKVDKADSVKAASKAWSDWFDAPVVSVLNDGATRIAPSDAHLVKG